MATAITTHAQYQEAVSTVKAWAAAYYTSDTLLADDDEYDALVTAIAAAEAANGWTSDVRAVAAGMAGGDVVHSRAMLSLDNAMTPEELASWISRMVAEGAELVVEPKLDGLAIAATYVGGQLVRVATRGDGKAGEDVTARASAILGLPATLTEPLDCEVRGECYLDHQGLEAANLERVSRGKSEFVNARNAVAGMVRSKNEPYRTPLRFAAYDFDTERASTYTDSVAEAARLGIATARALLPENSSVADQVRWVETNRGQLGYDVDGCVLKVDQFDLRRRLGESSRAPRWAIAYKFAAEVRRTTLRGITVEVGRSGVLTFTADLEPVFVGQATVKAATLHNLEDMLRRVGHNGKLYTNVAVFVRRAGDVIPEIVGLAGNIDQGATEWQPPTACPRCGGSVTRNGPKLLCSQGRQCGLAEWLMYAASRDCLDIEGLGDTVIAALVTRGDLTSLADVYTLTAKDLTSLERVGDKRGAQILSQIQEAKARTLGRQLAALGVAATGRRISERLAERFTTVQALLAAGPEDLETVEGVGAKKAIIIAEGLAEMAGEISRLVELGVNMTHTSGGGDSSGPFAGKTVCVTGTITGISRDEAQQLIVKAGGKVTSAVSTRLSVLVAGEKAGSKLTKAAQLGVTVMDGDQFLQAVAGYR